MRKSNKRIFDKRHNRKQKLNKWKSLFLRLKLLEYRRRQEYVEDMSKTCLCHGHIEIAFIRDVENMSKIRLLISL